MPAVTPMMRQYLDIKQQYKDCILLFRLGDFYEMFFEDAVTASKVLEIALTGRDCGQAERAPMCGVPHHSADSYIAKLVSSGYKVAVCEQMEDPATAKGIVKREVTRIITPGTVTESSMLDEKKNNYIMSVYKQRNYFGISVADLSTGEFKASGITFGNTLSELIDELVRVMPAEIIVNKAVLSDNALKAEITEKTGAWLTEGKEASFKFDNAINTLKNKFGDEFAGGKNDYDLSINAAGALLYYLKTTQKDALRHISNLEFYKIEAFMHLDAATRRNLELVETMRDRAKKGTLLWVLDRTSTVMGARLLRKWIEQPLTDVKSINDRLDAVEELKNNFLLRSELITALKKIYDIERLTGRIVMGRVNARDLISLKNSLLNIPKIKKLAASFDSGLLRFANELIGDVDDISGLIDSAISDDPPVSVKEGGIIKDGYNAEIDRLRSASKNGKQWMASLEQSEREKTGIKNLKIGYNRVFGYYIEVSKSNINLVPETYTRKQTLSNCERYITDELKKIEEDILGAEEKVVVLEYDLFVEIREKLAAQSERLTDTAYGVSILDVICSMAETAEKQNYCKPDVDDGDTVFIKDGRHPVVEKVFESEITFVPNDTLLDLGENRVSVITGPNMAGKSTYMRQTALIVLMAQAGSFVPASSARIGIVDKIFTRVGASDDLASGRSTFMVEMSEVANILQNATKRSLVIFDEIGRGTSTFDGLSIAWAVVEYVADPSRIGCRTMFSTHYHELTELEDRIPGIKNYRILVREKGDDIVFLRKIERGGADDSYGIQVAKLAGLPQPVVDRAKDILTVVEDYNAGKKGDKRSVRSKVHVEGQMDLFTFGNWSKSVEEVVEEIKSTDIQAMTPLDALNMLHRLQSKIKRI